MRETLDVSKTDKAKEDFLGWCGDVYREMETLVVNAAAKVWGCKPEEVTDDMLLGGSDYVPIGQDIMNHTHLGFGMAKAIMSDHEGNETCSPGSRTTVRWMVMCLVAEKMGVIGRAAETAT